MKRIFITFLIIFLTASVSLAMPGYNPETDSKPLIYDDSYNKALWEKLNNDFHKKYPATLTYDKDGYPVYTVNYPLNAYRDEVLTPYDLQKDYSYHYIK